MSNFNQLTQFIAEMAHTTTQSNGHHLNHASDEIVDITDEDEDAENDDDDDSEQRYVNFDV